MLPFASRSADPARPTPERALLAWLDRRLRWLARGTQAAFGVAVLLGVLPLADTPLGPPLQGRVLMGAVLLVLMGGAAWTATLAVRRRAAPVDGPLPAVRVPKVRIYVSMAEAQAAGWQFFGDCGSYSGQPIPAYAELDGRWFTYHGLDQDLPMIDDGDRVFGDLAYVQVEQVPEQPGPRQAVA